MTLQLYPFTLGEACVDQKGSQMPSLQQNNKHLPIASGSDNNDNDVGGVVEGSAMGNHEIVVITPRCFWLISVRYGLWLTSRCASLTFGSEMRIMQT